MFYVDSNSEYTIMLYEDLEFENQIISKTITDTKISIPDETWINENSRFYTYITSQYYKENALAKLISEKINCAYKEIYVYAYETKREYYDENYYTSIEGYIKDENDYKIFYTENQEIKIVEIINEKVVEVPRIEYIYLENIQQSTDSSDIKTCTPNTITETIIETKTETIEKESFKIPIQVYIVLIILFIIIVILLINRHTKNVE
jgi:hypothetical protein